MTFMRPIVTKGAPRSRLGARVAMESHAVPSAQVIGGRVVPISFRTAM